MHNMFNTFWTPVLTLVFVICQLSLVQATIYVTSPSLGSTCNGGQPCTVQWLDNGEAPFLTDIGPCNVGLYNGQQVLVQQIDPVDVGATHRLVFNPDPNAGPDSGTYYINFTSLNPVGDTQKPYQQFSPFFKLADMQGSFASPIPSDTSTLAVPSSIASGTTNSILTTNTIIVSPTPTPSSTHASSSPPSFQPAAASPAPSLSLTFSAVSSPSVPSSSPSSTSTGSSTGSTPSSSPSSTPASTLSSTPSLTPTSGGGTLTITPTSTPSGFSTQRAPTPSAPALNPTQSQTSAGNLDGKPSQHALAIVFTLSAALFIGGCAF